MNQDAFPHDGPGDLHRRAMLEHPAPSALIDASGAIVYATSGALGFLQRLDAGTALNLLDRLPAATRAEVAQQLRLHSAETRSDRADELRIRLDDGHMARVVRTAVSRDVFLVFFEKNEPWTPNGGSTLDSAEIERLQLRLRSAEADHDKASTLLTAGNEALQNFNEELKTTTAELRASQNDLRFSNQHLLEAVDASHVRVAALAGANSDIQNLMDATAIATVFVDRGFRIKRYTPAAASLFSLTPAGIGRTLKSLAVSLRYTDIEDDATAVLARLTPIEREVGHASGSWFLARLSPYRTAEDQIAGVVLSFIDITQRKHAEEVNQWLSAVVASSMDAIVSFSLTGMVLSWNAGAKRLFGYNASEMVGHSIERLADDAQLEESRWILNQVRERRAVEGLNTVRRARNGAALQVALTASPVIDSGGQVVGGAVSVRDVGEARRASEALRRSEERLRLVIENARDYAIFSTDLDRFITSWNKGAERLLGYTERDALGRPADVIFTAEDRAQNAPQHEALTALRHDRAADERFHVRKDGSRFWANGTLMRMDDNAGNALGFVKILRDETASRDAKAALERSQSELLRALEENQGARQALESADVAKDRFIAVLSHELRNPLASMLSAADLMVNADTTVAEKVEGAAIVRRQSLTMKALLDDLLDVSRLTANRFELKLQDVDLQDVIDHALESVEPLMRAAGHRLATQRPTGAVLVHIDDVRVGQVLVNLLTNAAKYTPPGGDIALSVVVEDSNLRVTVRDDGVGMHPETIDRMFELYTQGPPSPHGLNEGLGIGLALVRNIVRLHRGNVRAWSAGVGQGSTFEVTLPTPSQPTHRSVARPVSTTIPLSILIADDNRDAAWALSKLLQREGHNVLVASGGKAALALAETEGLEGAILDIGMPDLDGMEVARRLRERPAGRRMWLIALTGWGGDSNRRAILESGFDEHLIKPVDMTTLRSVLRTIAANHRVSK